MKAPNERRLTKILKRYLDIVWYVILIGLFFVPLVLGIAGVSLGGPKDRTLDVPIVLSFSMDEAALAGSSLDPTGAGSKLDGGQGELRIHTTSKKVWYLTLFLIEMVLAAILYGVGQMRGVFAALLRSEPFTRENPARIRKVGLVVIGWHTLSPFLKYYGAKIALPELSVPGLVLKPPVDFNFDGMIVGLAILLLAEVFQKASAMQREQSLTV